MSAIDDVVRLRRRALLLQEAADELTRAYYEAALAQLQMPGFDTSVIGAKFARAVHKRKLADRLR